MSREVARVSRKYLDTDTSLSQDVGRALLTVGAGGLTIGAVAWMLPLISLPMLLVAAVIAGVFLNVR